MPRIDPARVLGDLDRLRSFGAYKTGVHRPTYSPEDMAARTWFLGRLSEAGLAPEMDGIGNILALSPRSGPAMLTGSHLESQNQAGWLDGPLGCVYGLEAARALVEDPETADIAVDVAVFADEEGHYGSFLGSRSITGLLTEADIDEAKNRYHDTSLCDALKEAGLAGRRRVALDPARYRGFIEAHIEQGDRLDSSGLAIGVVTAIVAIWQYRITADGEQNHAGTTGMSRRRDAGLTLTRLLAAIDRGFPGIAGPASVWTTGRITLEPGAPSIVPGRAEALFQFRDADPAVLARMEAELRHLVAAANEGPCPVRLETLGQSRPAVMDEGLLAAIEAAAEAHAPGRSLRMPSGAGHDAQYLARVMPAAMLFVPSIGGISHHWTENTAHEDLVLGAQVYADAVARAARG